MISFCHCAADLCFHDPVTIVISFAAGLFGMILDQFPIILILRRCISIAVVFFLAVHIFVFHKKLLHKAVPVKNDRDFL